MARLRRLVAVSALCGVSLAAGAASAQALPTGQMLTPIAAPGAQIQSLATHNRVDYVADGAAAMALSPDRKTLLVLTSGYNVFNGPDSKRDPEISQQYLLVYDARGPVPKWRQTLSVPNAFGGVAWAPDGKAIYVGGGMDDVVHVFGLTKAGWAASGSPIALGHTKGLGAGVTPQTGAVAVSPSGRQLLVANYYNDSVSLIDLASRRIVAETDLRPGRSDPARVGVAGGEFPVSILWRGETEAFVSAARDREVVALSVGATEVKVTHRIAVTGVPTNLILDRSGERVLGVQDNADRLLIIDAVSKTLVAEPRLGLPDSLKTEGFSGKGVNPNALALGPDAKTLLVTYGGINALAVVDLEAKDASVVGLIPTGWYPSAVSLLKDGKTIVVANRKGPPGPNPKGCGPRAAMSHEQSAACGSNNQYVFQLEKGGLLSLPRPSVESLAKLTLQVADNIGAVDRPERIEAARVMAAVRSKIKHVVYIVKENRTYDQVLGDLEIGNGDPGLAILGGALTPNHHSLARNFITFDNFYDSGEQSSTGWNWSTAARATDMMERTASVNYAGRGLSYEGEGTDRNVNVALPMAERGLFKSSVPADPDLLPGKAHLTSPDGDDDDQAGEGFIWDAALRARLSVRNYGFVNEGLYDPKDPKSIPVIREPFKEGRKVYVSASQSLAPVSDPYFRGFDQALADFWRVKEWAREFDQQVASKDMPALTLLRVSHDHFGSFGDALDKVNTVQTQMADNDYAIGLITEKIAASPFADSTLIFIIEDDAQNGADHVDARRSLAYIIGPYVKQKALISNRYTTVSLMRTIEDVLGLKPLGLNDALALPMYDAFDLSQDRWTYKALVPPILYSTDLPLPPVQTAEATCPGPDAAFWEIAMKGQDFTTEDHLDADGFNKALWKGLAGERAQPGPTGKDLRQGRDGLLARQPTCQTN